MLKFDGTGNYNHIQVWFNANNPASNNKSIDIKSKLNTKLKIKNFEDLKRYYKSISIYYDFNIDVVKGSNNNHGSNFRTTESFHPSKNQSSILEINLKDLVFSQNVPNFDKYQDFVQDVNWNGGGGYAYYQGNKSQYNLLTYEFTLNENGSFYINKSFSNSNAIGLDILTNTNDYLNWKINIFITPSKIDGEYERIGIANAYGQRYTNNGTANIDKIILNPR